MRRTVTAIIPHYWDTRTADLPRIVEALNCGTLAPREVIIWNNTDKPVSVVGAAVINAGRNWGITARFAAAYLAQSEFVLFQDNDLMVEPGTVQNMMDRTCGVPGVSVELQGRMLGNHPSAYTTSVYHSNVDRVVDVGLSRISLMLRETAMQLCREIPPDVTDDDLWVSRYCTIKLVPYGPGEGWINLPEHEGLSRDVSAHVARRDELALKLWGR